MSRRWTAVELDTLQRMLERGDFRRVIARKLGRSTLAVRQKARDLTRRGRWRHPVVTGPTRSRPIRLGAGNSQSAAGRLDSPETDGETER